MFNMTLTMKYNCNVPANNKENNTYKKYINYTLIYYSKYILYTNVYIRISNIYSLYMIHNLSRYIVIISINITG